MVNFSEYETPLEQCSNKPTVFPLPRENLKDIEEKCQSELVKLNAYIDSIKQLKKVWRNALNGDNFEGLGEKTNNETALENQNVFEGSSNYLKS